VEILLMMMEGKFLVMYDEIFMNCHLQCLGDELDKDAFDSASGGISGETAMCMKIEVALCSRRNLHAAVLT
jgi:hypothetical protein